MFQISAASAPKLEIVRVGLAQISVMREPKVVRLLVPLVQTALAIVLEE